MASTFQLKVKELDKALTSENLDLSHIRTLCGRGIPEGLGRRSTSWRILLNYLPLTLSQWPQFLNEQRELYDQLLDEMVLNPGKDDHPLNMDPGSQWVTFFKDNEVLLQIDKDVRRLCPDISFFSQATEFPRCSKDPLHLRVQGKILKSQSVHRNRLGISKLIFPKKKSEDDYAPLDRGQEAHWEVVERILFLYAKLNPGQGYVQGMNEIIGPIYYVFASDPRKDWREHAEADCFFCFTHLMSEIRDFFIKTLDESESGINGMMVRFTKKVSQLDPRIGERLAAQDIRPQYFSFRWLTLILTQEFPLPDVLRIWDSVLTDETRSDLLIDICTAMVLIVREDILNNDFADNMKLLQKYPSMDVDIILSKAASLASNSN